MHQSTSPPTAKERPRQYARISRPRGSLVRGACLRPWLLVRCTFYPSAEPCAMCAGAIYWVRIGRVVYRQTELALKAQTGAHEENPPLDLPRETVFAAGQRQTEVVGPLLEDEAAELQADFWNARGYGCRISGDARTSSSIGRTTQASTLTTEAGAWSGYFYLLSNAAMRDYNPG